MHKIEKESGGGLEPLQPSLASTRWRMGHPPIVRMIPKLVVWHRTFTYMLPRTGFHSSHRRRFLEYILFHIPIDLAMSNGFFLWITDKSTPLKLVAPAGFEPTHKESESSVLPDYTKEQLNRLVVPLGFAPRPYTFKGCRTAIIPWNIRERVSIRPHWFSILYTWACNI